MAQVGRLGPKVGSRLVLFCIHRSRDPSELSQRLSHDDSTVNTVIGIAIIITSQFTS